MPDIVRIGFVGVGTMGQCAHLRNYVGLAGCQVVALAEIQRERAQRVAQRYGVPKVYADHREMLAREKLDGIVASQPFTRHGSLVPELLQAGVPIFTEKPLAGSIEAGEKILGALAKSKTWHMVGYHKRSDPASMYAKGEIDRLKASRELGALKYVRILMPAGDWIANGFWDLVPAEGSAADLQATAPGGWDPPASDMDKPTYDLYVSFVNYYIHQVNLMRFLLGEPYRVTYADPSGVLLAGQSTGGVGCTIEMSPYSTTIDWQEEALVCFERGWVHLQLPAPLAFNRPGRVRVFKDPGKGATPQTLEPQLPWDHAMRQQAANFVGAIAGKVQPPCQAAEALEDLKVAREYIRLWKGK